MKVSPWPAPTALKYLNLWPRVSEVSTLIGDIARLPRHRPGRQRTSPRTTDERRNGHTENVSYTITIEKSNLPEWDITSNT
jgi:hypothetical protein